MTPEHWHTEAEYMIVGLDPDTDLEPFSAYASEIRYDQDDGILHLAARLAATSHPDADAEARAWLAQIRQHLAAAGHPGTPIRHTIQTEAVRARAYAPGTAEAAEIIGLDTA